MIQLTTKQQEVCDLVTKGWTAKEIAQRLGIGSRTVESHRNAIYEKMGVHNAVQLTRKILGASE